MADDYELGVDWFSATAPLWRSMLESIKPRRVLEIGSFEGRSAIFLIETCAPVGPFEITCVDTWSGGVEHSRVDMREVEAKFDRNIARATAKYANVTVNKIKSDSALALASLLAQGQAGAFDVAYIDGSHQAPDVLADAVLAFKLLRIGGIMVFDDYLWHIEANGQQDLLNMPKLAIDAFINLNIRKLNVVADAPLRQMYIAKVSD
ncbi:MAG: class I SAM-dependent methyltransferase [Hyphomonadaceae bacterium]|nr:class I SAM-dependent methyltransferase [Hyphomonadaceae bacterium]